MPSTNRYFESGAMYEICFRAKSTLPLVAYKCINYAILCILARVQRDNKVTLCHYIWNGSHPHILVVSKDAAQLVKFYMEIKKKITDILKCLLGLDNLSLWEENTSVIRIGDLEAAKKRVAYLYSNPAQDNLEDSIELFPGLSTWTNFQQCLNELNAQSTEKFPWIRLKTIPKLSNGRIDASEDLAVIQSFQLNKYWYKLKLNPNAWMKCFDIKSDGQAKFINEEILRTIRDNERVAREIREKKKMRVLGSEKLKSQEILQPHKPKKRGIKIFIITTDNELRLNYIARVKRISALCRKCYQRWKKGELSIKWPDGVFRPSCPPLANLLAI